MRFGFSVLAAFLALVAPLCAMGPVATASSPSDARAAGLQGVFERWQGDGDQIRAAVERAVAGAGPLVRPIARKRLLHANRAFHRVRIAQEGGRIVVQLGDAPPVVSPADGRVAPYDVPGGKRAHVRQRIQGRTLVQHFQNRDGERVNRFVQSEDGRQLVYRVTVTSKHLPEPVRYTLRFRRVE